VLVAGDTTGGGSANPTTFELAGGWSVSVPRWMSYDAFLRPVEWLGVAPDSTITASAADFASGRDPVLDFAQRWAAIVTSRSTR
jgi:hypothetical protein